MNTLLAGGAGYIGSHMAWRLHDAGHPFVILDNLSTGSPDNLPPGAKLVVGEISDVDLVRDLIRSNEIQSAVHFAARTVVPESIRRPVEYYDNNVVGTLRLASACSTAGIRRFVFSSTAAVYGDVRSTAVAEEAPVAPLSPYGWSKLMCERMLHDIAQVSDMAVVALRYFNVAGADPRGRAGQSTPSATHLFKVACEVASGKRECIEVFGDDYPTPDGTCIRDYIHVADLAEIHLKALLSTSAEPFRIFNCGYGAGASVRQVIEAVSRVSGVPIPVTIRGRRPGDAVAVVAAASKVREALQWSPAHDDLATIAQHAYEWERRQARK